MINYKKGFTLVELLVVLAIIGVLVAVVSLPIVKFKGKQALENNTNSAIAILNDARAKTLAGLNNNQYGVHIQSDKLVLFSGVTYNPSATNNEQFYFDDNVTMTNLVLNTGGSDIKFDRLKGTTTQYGTIVLTLSGGNSRTITVSQTGTIQRN